MAENPNDPSGYAGGSDSGNVVTEQVKHGTQQAVQATQQAAGQVVDQVQGQAQSMFESRKGQATESMNQMAQALRQTGDSLRTQNQESIAGMTDSVATRIEGFATYLEQRDAQQLIGEVERYARNNPAVFLGGAFALGVLAARFLKSSSPQPSRGRYSNNYGTYGREYFGGQGAGYQTGYYPTLQADYTVTPAYTGVSETYPADTLGARTQFAPQDGGESPETFDVNETTADLGTSDGTRRESY